MPHICLRFFYVPPVSIPRGTVVVWDVGGQERLRALWRSVYYGTGAIIFVVDSTDVQRLETARVELHALLKEQELVGVPVLVLANKQDAVGALDMEGVRETLKLEALRPRTVSVLATSAASGSGIPAVIEWLGKQVLSPKDIPKHAAEQARLALQMEAEYEAEVSRQSRQST